MRDNKRMCDGNCAGCDDNAHCILSDVPDLHLKERKLSSETVYDGKIIKVTKDTVSLEDGKETLREVVHHPGGACVVPVTDDGEVILVRQYRYPHGTETLEVPAGKLEYGEDPMECGKRELLEETGATADAIYSLGQLLPTPAYDKEVIYMYLAQGLHFEEQKLDEGEFLDIVKMPLQKAVKLVMQDKIRDAKTQIALMKTMLMIMGIE